MIVPDANLLIYAYDESFPEHGSACRWWEEVMNGEEPVGVPWVVVLAFVRVATHPSVAAAPRSVAEVRAIVDSWFERPHVRVLGTTSGTLPRFFDMLGEAGLGGNLSTDALIAAQATEWGGRICSNDRDFDRFSKVVRENPLA